MEEMKKFLKNIISKLLYIFFSKFNKLTFSKTKKQFRFRKTILCSRNEVEQGEIREDIDTLAFWKSHKRSERC